MPVKNGTETVCVLLYWLNARGFKRDGSALHLQRISPLQKANFWENALSDKSERHAGAEISPHSCCDGSGVNEIAARVRVEKSFHSTPDYTRSRSSGEASFYV